MNIDMLEIAANKHSLISQTDCKGIITEVNDNFCRISGYSKLELIGERHSLLNSKEQSSDYWLDMYKSCKKHGFWHDEVRNVNKAGGFYWVDTTIVAIKDNSGKLSGYLSIRTETTAIKKLEIQRKERLNELTTLISTVNKTGDITLRVVPKNDDDQLAHSLNSMISMLDNVTSQADTIAKGDYTAEIAPRSEKDRLGIALQHMTKTLRENEIATEQKNWIDKGISGIYSVTKGERNILLMAKSICRFLAKYLNAPMLSFYIPCSGHLKLVGGYALPKCKQLGHTIEFGEGLIGQVALENQRILLGNIPNDYININSSLGNACPSHLIISPFNVDDKLQGVIEIASFTPFEPMQLELLSKIEEQVGIMLRSVNEQDKTQQLLEQTQRQTEELQAQQEELKTTNNNLEEQTQHLRASEEELQSQSEELKVSNEELSKKSLILVSQKEDIEKAARELKIKSDDLAITSQYKSDFLANMSHELRTPLNSFLLLSKGLSDNTEGNLTEEQLEDINIIYEGGSDLLILINDIMDLSKVEAGHLSINNEMTHLTKVVNNLQLLFKANAKEKNLSFTLNIDENLPNTIFTDPIRLDQILKNLLSNAFKFTSQGEIQLNITRTAPNCQFLHSDLTPETAIAFSVIDSGVGVSEEKQKIIFEAFQQEDGTVSRQYGGTGLGLTISRELSALLGGEIQLQSKLGKGSQFTLYLPLKSGALSDQPTITETQNEQQNICLNPRVQSNPLLNTNKVPPDVDDQNSFVFDAQSKIPAQIKTILIVEDDKKSQYALSKLLQGNKQVNIECVGTGAQAFDIINSNHSNNIDCVILDLGLPDMTGFALLEKLTSNTSINMPSVIIYTGKELNQQERILLQQYRATVILKGAISPDKLLNEAMMFLHSEDKNSAISQQTIKTSIDEPSDILKAKKVLLVDDDIRNTFALSKQLQKIGMIVIEADNGLNALNRVKNTKDIDIILMDIMMPTMDGFEAMIEIRKIPQHATTPIIALTAKGMLTDRQQCIDAGATDYLSKPIDLNKLLSIMKVWLFKQ